MDKSNSFLGAGTIISRSDSEFGTYLPIAEITSSDGPQMTRDVPDVSHLKSLGGYRSFISGFKDAGSLNLNMNFTHDTYEQMLDDFESGYLKWYRIEMSNDAMTRFTFRGLVTNCPVALQTTTQVLSNVSLKISGKIKFVKMIDFYFAYDFDGGEADSVFGADEDIDGGDAFDVFGDEDYLHGGYANSGFYGEV
jgi:hypothetical protein